MELCMPLASKDGVHVDFSSGYMEIKEKEHCIMIERMILQIYSIHSLIFVPTDKIYFQAMGTQTASVE